MKRDRKEYFKQRREKLKLKERNKIENKTCSICNENKSILYFSKKCDNCDGFRSECKACASHKNKKYFEENKDIKREKSIIWRQKNKEYMRIYQRTYQKEKRDNDPSYRLRQNISRAIRATLNGAKNRSILNILPYSIETLKQHLQNQFNENMTWENYGSYWEIDHIYPQSKLLYNSIEDENFEKCWALNNLQPLSINDNRKKHNNLQ